MIYGGQTVGALVVKNVSATTNAFSDHHGALLSALADYAAIAYKTQGQVKVEDPLLPSRLVKPKSIFVSYRHDDYPEYVKPLVETLSDNGMNVWIDQSYLEGGQEWLDKVTHALDECSVLVLCVSPGRSNRVGCAWNIATSFWKRSRLFRSLSSRPACLLI